MVKKQDVFLEYYKKLNSEQKRAVDEIDGPVMVIAGPGTGKTQILTLRIANILRKTDTDARSILALTFTEAGTIAMRKRLSEIIGESAYYVNISTFHGFCNDIIKQYPEEFPHIISSRNITEVEQIQIIEEIVYSLKLNLLKPFGNPLHYISSILSNIDNLKREGIDALNFSKNVLDKKENFLENPDIYYKSGAHIGKIKGKYKDEEKILSKNEEFSIVYKKYEIELQKRKLYDYSDMIMEVWRALSKNEDLLLTLQERYQYFLVDEHQDTNNAQNKVLELLTSFYENPNLFIVGDEKQAIFRFQGASLKNFLYFQKKYPKTKKIVLKENYRSTQSILDSTQDIAQNISHKSLALTSKDKKGGEIYVRAFSKESVELAWMSTDIKEKIKEGTPPNEIAVLYRDNKDAFAVIDYFEKWGIVYSLESDQNILDDKDIQKLISILRAVQNLGSDTDFFDALHIDFLNIHPLDIYEMANFSRKSRGVISLFDIAGSKQHLSELNIQSKDTISDFYKNLILWKRLDKNYGLVRVFEEVVQNSGYLSYILSLQDSLLKIEKTNALFDEIRNILTHKRNATLEDFFSYIQTLTEHNLSIKKSLGTSKENAVHLMTAHKSKGREFKYIYIIHMNDGKWGNKRKKDLLPLIFFSENGEADILKLEDERRLFYVALTRAKFDVSLSYFLQNNEGREQPPSQFLYEFDKKNIKECDMSAFEKKYEKNPIVTIKRKDMPPEDEKKLIQKLFKERGFAVTHLNNFLQCPWEYFYVNLLRIPQAPTKHQMYGTAIHGTLRDFFDSFKKTKKMGARDLVRRFKEHLKKEYLSEDDFTDLKLKGERALNGWYNTYNGTWDKKVFITEKDIRGVFLDKNINLTGKIDRMDLLDNDKVIVTDYKTGKQKSRNEIEGNTKNSDGNIKRQLIFYKLLLEKYEKGRYKMNSAIIDFIEPDEKGRYKREEFEISLQEVKDLERLIKKIAQEIMSFSFVNERCDRKDCKYCKLREMMK